MVNSAVSIKNLYIKRGKRLIINDFSLEVPEGSFTVISGPSGCGKSTLLLAIQGLIPCLEDAKIKGEIFVNGKIVDNETEEKNAPSESSFLMQNVDAQIVNTIARDEMAFGLENLGISREFMFERVKDYSDIFNIDLTRNVLELSGGQKQRLLIASCLATGRKVVLLDEPFANLDHKNVDLLKDIIRKLIKEDFTFICVEHRLELIYDIADTLIWFNEKEIQKFEGKEIENFTNEKISTILKDTSNWNMESGAPILTLSNLDAVRGERQVIKNLDLSLNKGTTTMLTGNNGCGKTTLLHVLCGLSKYGEFDAENFSINNQDYLKRHSYRHLKKEVGLVFQNPVHQLFMPTVEEEIMVRCGDEKIRDEIIALFGLENIRYRHPYSLSHGEKRRVSTATVTATGTPFTLMDEPTIGQDYDNLKRMAYTLKTVQDEKKITFFIATHDDLALKLFGGNTFYMPEHNNI